MNKNMGRDNIYIYITVERQLLHTYELYRATILILLKKKNQIDR